VLDLFLGGGACHTLTAVSERLGIPKSTAHGILHAMRRRGYLTWDPVSKTYAISLQLVGRAGAAPVVELVRLRARRHLERLAATLGETALLIGYERDLSVAIDVVEGVRPLKYAVALGKPWPLHATGGGKLYLAQFDDDEVRARLAELELERITAQTTVDVEALVAEVAEARRAGWAQQREEIIDEISGFAAPVRDANGRLLASLVVTGPIARLDAQRSSIVTTLVEEARSLSRELGALEPRPARESVPVG
jgi:DNA-binding IclR family transcriptional regulator